jgi:hypothetical protein
MTSKFLNFQNQNVQGVVYCPIANKQVTGDSAKPIFFLGEQATWWHCSVCEGWHLSTGKTEERSELVYSFNHINR